MLDTLTNHNSECVMSRFSFKVTFRKHYYHNDKISNFINSLI